LTRADLEGRLRGAGFRYTQQHRQAMRAMIDIEHGRLSGLDLLLLRILASLSAWLRSAIPTLIYTLQQGRDRSLPDSRSS
jgi:hypothetical protein